MTTIELVRHAVAVPRDRWATASDRARPLTDLGHAQARQIGRELRREGPVARLYSSPSVRCVDTLRPLAVALGVDVVEDDALGEAPPPVVDSGQRPVAGAWLAGRALAFIERVVLAHPEERVVACSHGDVIPVLMAALAGRDGLDVGDLGLAKGARFSLAFDGLRCVKALAFPSPEAGPEDAAFGA